MCRTRHINPLNLGADTSDLGGESTVGKRKRKRRIVKRTMRNKRQESPPPDQGLSKSVIVVSIVS